MIDRFHLSPAIAAIVFATLLSISCRAQGTATPFSAPLPTIIDFLPGPGILRYRLDWNGDGRIDRIRLQGRNIFVSLRLSNGQYSHFVLLYTGNPNVTYGSAIFEDFNFDGFLDILVTERSSSSGPVTIAFLLTSFSAAINVRVPVGMPASTAAYDVHEIFLLRLPGDPFPAIAVQSYSSSAGVLNRNYVASVLQFDSGTNLWEAEFLGLLPNMPMAVARALEGQGPSGDFDGDGLMDWVFELRGPCSGTSPAISTFCQWAIAYGLPQSPWFDWSRLQAIALPPVPLPMGGTILSAESNYAVADVNRDGFADLLISRLIVSTGSGGTFPIRASDVVVAFGSPQRPLGSQSSVTSLVGATIMPPRPTFADYDGDGVLDFAHEEDLGAGASRLRFLRGYRDGTFGAAMISGGAAIQPFSLTLIEDIDGDGDADLVDERTNAMPPSLPAVMSNETILAGGTACPNGGLPEILVETPRLGNASFALRLESAPPNATAFLGLSLAPAPVLGAIGLDLGLLLFPLGGLGLTTTNALGEASIGIPIPNAPSLAGATVYAQWAVAAASPFGFCATPVRKVILWP